MRRSPPLGYVPLFDTAPNINVITLVVWINSCLGIAVVITPSERAASVSAAAVVSASIVTSAAAAATE